MNAVTVPPLADQMRGVEPRRLDMVMPHLVNDLYDANGDGRLNGAMGWRPLSDDEMRGHGVDPSMQVSTKNGLLSQVYTDDQGNFALVYAGSNEFKDWIPTNFGQGLGFETAQYSQAIRLAQACQQAFGDNLVLSGQSLGGGLAASASMVTGVPAVTYNTAGVHRRTIERLGVDFAEARAIAAEGNIRNYRVDGEFLTQLQEKTPIMRALMPDAVGVQIDLPNPEPEQRVTVRQSIKLHLIPAIVDSMELQYPEWARNPLSSPPMLDDPAHPDHAMYQQSHRAVRQWEEQHGVAPGEHTRNLAAALTLEARRTGMQQVDGVVMSEDGRRAFAVTRSDLPDDRQIAHVETSSAIRTPLQESSRQSLQLAAENQDAAEQVQLARTYQDSQTQQDALRQQVHTR